MSSKTARDIMRARLVTLRPDQDIFDAISLLLKNQISGAPVIDMQRNFLGMFSERTCMSLIVKAAYDQVPTNIIEPFVQQDVPTITADADLLTIAETFHRTNVRRLPVLDGTELIGQISRRDLMAVVHQQMRTLPASERTLLYLSSIVDREDAPFV